MKTPLIFALATTTIKPGDLATFDHVQMKLTFRPVCMSDLMIIDQ